MPSIQTSVSIESLYGWWKIVQGGYVHIIEPDIVFFKNNLYGSRIIEIPQSNVENDENVNMKTNGRFRYRLDNEWFLNEINQNGLKSIVWFNIDMQRKMDWIPMKNVNFFSKLTLI